MSLLQFHGTHHLLHGHLHLQNHHHSHYNNLFSGKVNKSLVWSKIERFFRSHSYIDHCFYYWVVLIFCRKPNNVLIFTSLLYFLQKLPYFAGKLSVWKLTNQSKILVLFWMSYSWMDNPRNCGKYILNNIVGNIYVVHIYYKVNTS